MFITLTTEVLLPLQTKIVILHHCIRFSLFYERAEYFKIDFLNK